MGRSLLAEVALTEKEVKARFLAYLKQRGVVTLAAFCTAVNLPVRPGTKFNRAHAIDRLVTPLLPSPDCRVEEGKGTAHWEVRYYAKPPKEPSFAPRPQGQMTVTVDPHLKGRWRRGDPTTDAEAEARHLRRERQKAFDAALEEEREEAKAWAKDVVPVAPEPYPQAPEPSPPNPLSQGGEGEPEAEIPPAPLGKGGDEDDETTTTEMTEMARTNRSREQCIADLDRVLAELPSLDKAELSLGGILRAGKFSTAYFANNPDQHRKAKRALKAEKVRRLGGGEPSEPSPDPSEPSPEPSEPSPPSPLSQEGEGEPETETEMESFYWPDENAVTITFSQEGEGEPEPPLEDLREDYERQIRELREELERTTAGGLREKLEAQIATLDLELLQTRNEIRRLEGELDRRTADLMALRRTAELLGVAG